ncbi:hypothetical protein BH11GEM1_BH11GEM1_02660 [soil metagenome]
MVRFAYSGGSLAENHIVLHGHLLKDIVTAGTGSLHRWISLVRMLTRSLLVVIAMAAIASCVKAQGSGAEGRAVIAVADSVLAALSTGNSAALARLTLDSSVVGGAGVRDGVERLSLRTWRLYIDRPGAPTFTERGFGATARVQDRVAQVWMPYDLYIGNTWSHCGVDTFTMMKRDGRWRVAALIYTIEQPPACNRHPTGPP